jgi:hypothetical protein
MQNKTFTSSLQRSTHFLPVGGDLRQNYTPFGTPGSGSGYSYLKCEVVTNSTKVEFDLTNRGETANAVAAFSTALVKQDADLYANPGDNPGVTPPVWTVPPIGTGGTVTVVPGGMVNVQFTTATAKDGGQDTLAVRVKLAGSPLKVEAWTPGTCELY